MKTVQNFIENLVVGAIFGTFLSVPIGVLNFLSPVSYASNLWIGVMVACVTFMVIKNQIVGDPQTWANPSARFRARKVGSTWRLEWLDGKVWKHMYGSHKILKEMGRDEHTLTFGFFKKSFNTVAEVNDAKQHAVDIIMGRHEEGGSLHTEFVKQNDDRRDTIAHIISKHPELADKALDLHLSKLTISELMAKYW